MTARSAARDLHASLFDTTQALPAVADELPVPRLRRLMLKALVLPLAVMLLLCALLAFKLVAAAEDGAEAARARTVIAEANRVQRLVIDQEAALRGYVIDHEDMFLPPLHLGHVMVPPALRRLAELTAGDPEQEARAAALAAAYGRWAGATGLAPTATRSGGPLVRPGEASRLQLAAREAQLDAVRQLVRQLVDAEDQRLRDGEAAGGWSLGATVLGGAIALALIGFTTSVLRRSIRRMEGIYAKALALRRHSEANERAARQSAEALAAEVTAQSHELQTRFRAMRDELELARVHLRTG
ncbi:CHASE3 domain-containing protein [Nannocystis sp. ILAH1]|uniref:CHASE3 domain-containing protein n=1 Tax=Nannocystis sp. ILAH1 TaxID=2996789 RepID=UPI002271E0DF|nr:CHASE3 domain-containing protein [Nannocystis sp. ILAH1]MCY0990553.1 CHASE3 domain-containing protein [Nannocystis sp. ILAH1]